MLKKQNKKLYAKQLNTLYEIDKFLERHGFWKLTQQEPGNSNKISVEKIKVVIQIFQQEV